jgi:hypothetical protein
MRQFIALALPFIIVSCGGSSGGTTPTATSSSSALTWSTAFPTGMVVSSPTANSSTSLAATSLSSSATFSEKKAIFETLETTTSSASCIINLPTISSLGQRATCYGPSISYTDHLDAAGSGTLPTGDLGLWERTEGSTGVACAAAQLNTLIDSASSYIDNAMGLAASVACLARVNSLSIPAEGASLDMTSTIQTALTAASSSVTVSSVTATQEDGAMKIVMTASLPGSKTITLTTKHKEASSSSFQGLMWGSVTGTNKDAFSLRYKLASSRYNIEFSAGTFSSGTSDSTIFPSVGSMALTGFFGNMNHALYDISSIDGTGNISFAWQAGSGDSNTRVFNAYVDSNAGVRSGCGYFGFGSGFSSTASSNTNAISKFICNWAGPGNSHTGLSGRAQKQCFSEVSGKLAPVSAQSFINYAPINACETGTPGTFTYTYPTHYASVVSTHQLITLSTDSEYSANYTAPAIPTISF